MGAIHSGAFDDFLGHRAAHIHGEPKYTKGIIQRRQNEGQMSIDPAQLTHHDDEGNQAQLAGNHHRNQHGDKQLIPAFIGKLAEGISSQGAAQAAQDYIENGDIEAIEKIAEGRVWTGAAAKELGLVDELGGLEKAIDIAAQKAGIEAYSTISYPEQEGVFSAFLEQTKEDYIQGQMAKTMGEYYPYVKFMQNVKDMDRIQARLPFELHIR